jgi:hypothetical protein
MNKTERVDVHVRQSQTSESVKYLSSIFSGLARAYCTKVEISFRFN